ncbi:MAG: DUF3841 domain-containing protein [Gammaproteobacteria bacterium]|nr:DUF3841 domain-containing protein [Gammaproteobacteria bacterium]
MAVVFDSSSTTLILWTIQTEPAVRRMERTRMLRGDGRRIWPAHRRAFQWMNEQMRRRLGPPPRGSRYPVWAWKVYDSDSPRPDLRCVAHLPRGTRGARLEIDVPDERVLLSDFMRWHSVLNGGYLYDDLREDEEMETPAGLAVSGPCSRKLGAYIRSGPRRSR